MGSPHTSPAKRRTGFTLIELVIVVSVLAVLAAVTFVAADPARRMNAARNAGRRAAVTELLRAIRTYQADSTGSYLPGKLRWATEPNPAGLRLDWTKAYIIGAAPNCQNPCPGASPYVVPEPDSGCSIDDLAAPLLPYLKKLPRDPATGSADDTRYFINKSQAGVLTIGACDGGGEGPNGSGIAPVIKIEG